MKVSSVKALCSEWVRGRSRDIPNFAGAYFNGYINALSDNDQFPKYRDVDIHIIVDAQADDLPAKSIHVVHGITIDIGYRLLSDYKEAASVLCDPYRAYAVRAGNFIEDPTDILAKISAEAERSMAENQWRMRRCGVHMQFVTTCMQALTSANDSYHFTANLSFF